jgi:hypothetical protein
MFVYYAWEDQGSGNVIQGYTQAARALGHEVTVFGPPHPRIPLNYSRDIASVDAVLFVFEWTTQMQHGDQLDLVRMFGHVPRSRRVILDGDGNYNDLLCADGDFNHRDEASARRWVEFCDSLTDKICQPTLHPLRPNVRPFLFYAYDPAWERDLNLKSREFGMIYVGHCKFRWKAMRRILEAIEPVRDEVGRIGMVGEGWAEPPWWAETMNMQDVYHCDYDYLRRLRVEALPPVPFPQVVNWMSRARFNPVILRPLFGKLRFVTPRLFETVAAGTIPVFGFDDTHVREIYGERALEVTLPASRAEKRIADLERRPEHYTEVVRELRAHLAEKHSHRARLRELIEIIES